MSTLAELRAIANGDTLSEAVRINAYPPGKVDDEEIASRGEACNVYVKNKHKPMIAMLHNILTTVESRANIEEFAIDKMFKVETPKYPKWTIDQMVTTNPNFNTNRNTGRGTYGPKFLNIVAPTYYFTILDADLHRFRAKGYSDELIEDIYYSVLDGFARTVQLACKNDGLNVVVGMTEKNRSNPNSHQYRLDLCITYNEAKKLLKR